MIAAIQKSSAKGAVQAPPAKSAAHRALICAALSEGESKLFGASFSEDIEATVRCLRALGAVIEASNGALCVRGIEKAKKRKEVLLDCGESGSTLRFLMPLSLIFSENAFFCGHGRLIERPQSIYEELLPKMGAAFQKQQNGLLLSGSLHSGDYALRGDVSSQFVTGLLFVLPLLSGESRLRLLPPVESAPYIDLTLQFLRESGITITRCENTFIVPGWQKYLPKDRVIEGDYSNAAFLAALNELGGEVRVEGLLPNSIQGDKVFIEYFRALRSSCPTLDITDCPDLGPVLMALAPALHGCVLTGTRRLRFKESDRAQAMREELSAFGVTAKVGEDEVRIPKTVLCAPNRVLQSHGDHRIAMALALLCTLTGGSVAGAEAVNKSYPLFFEDLESLGIAVEIRKE